MAAEGPDRPDAGAPAGRRLIDEAWLSDLDEEADVLAKRIRRECQTMPNPPHTEMFEHVYAEPHPGVDREAAQFADYHAGFEDD